MKNQHNDVWIGIKDKTNDPELQEITSQEFYELPVVDALSDNKLEEHTSSRRDFLKYLGFGLGAATIAAGCEIPVKKAIPYVVKPDEIVPGVATYYASSFVNGGDYCSILVKTREGRPIKIEGNPSSKVTKGGTSARAQASVLDLYNTERFRGASSVKEGNVGDKMTWAELDKAVGEKLQAGSNVRIITGTVLSPTMKKVFADFTAKYPNTKVVAYDAISSAAMLLANEECFGDRAIPSYHFDKADMVVTFGADFLGTWISPVEYAADWAKTRRVKDVNKPHMSRLVAFESGMSLTGSNADNRVFIRPSQQGEAVVGLYNALNGGPSSVASAKMKEVAKELLAAKGKALVVSNSNDKNVQIVVNKINDLLGSYGSTISFANASLQRQGVDTEMQDLIKEMNGGGVDVAIVYGANPA
jgi:molybdopterin-containing oxidoreductase family iron-sulfur binding subunit